MDYVGLTIIMPPVVVNNPPHSVQFGISGRSRIRNHQADGSIVQANLSHNLNSPGENIFIILLKTKHNAGLKGNTILMGLFYQTFIRLNLVVGFISTIQTMLVDTFQANKQSFTTTFGRQMEKLGVSKRSHGGLTGPPFFERR